MQIDISSLTGQALSDLYPDEILAHYPDIGCRLVLNRRR